MIDKKFYNLNIDKLIKYMEKLSVNEKEGDQSIIEIK